MLPVKEMEPWEVVEVVSSVLSVSALRGSAGIPGGYPAGIGRCRGSSSSGVHGNQPY